MVPSTFLTPHIKGNPTLKAVKVPTGVSSVLPPQHVGVPSVLRPHASPQLTLTELKMPLGAEPLMSVASPQQTIEPSVLREDRILGELDYRSVG